MSNLFEKTAVKTQCACIYNDKIWYFSVESNALLCMDMVTFESEFVMSVEGFLPNQRFMFTDIISYEDSLILVPYVAKDIFIFYPMTNKTERIILNTYDEITYFSVSNYENNKIVLFPALKFPYYYIYDMGNHVVQKKNIDFEKLGLEMTNNSKTYFMTARGFNGHLYTNLFKKDKFVVFDILSCCFKITNIHSLSGESININTICFMNKDKAVALNAKGDEVLYISEDGTVEESYVLNPVSRSRLFLEKDAMGYSDVARIDDNSWVAMPIFGNDVVIYKNKEMVQVPINWDRIIPTIEQARIFYSMLTAGEYIYLLPYQSGTIIRINLISYDIDYYEKQIMDTERFNKICSVYLEKEKSIVYEGELGFGDYCQLLT
ncbi:MAG: hypothetical protein K6D96_01940 [Acetatifactor sp.]|nr:hypothetical protein [Acetatifactor sp.]